MSREQIRAKVLQLLTQPQFTALQVDPASVRDDTSLLNDLGMDSLQILGFIVEIENAFGFRLGSGSVSLDTFDRFDRVVDVIDETQKLTQQ